MDVIKLSDNQIQVSKQKEAPEPEIVTYDYEFLISQKSRIIADADSYIDARQKELDEVNDLIAQAEALGVTAKEMPKKLEG